jgi:hypothetical protein
MILGEVGNQRMACALRVVIILVICSSISSATSVSGKAKDQENQLSGISARIVEAIKRYLIHDLRSEDNSYRYWSIIDRLVANERLSTSGRPYLHRDGEDQTVEAKLPASFTLRNEKRDSTGINSLRDNRIQDGEGEATLTFHTLFSRKYINIIKK